MDKKHHIHSAMVLAAGMGTRMRPLTLKIPKPLIKIYGRTLLDRALDQLERAGIENAVVNIHHLGQQIEDHLKMRHKPHILISDECSQLLDSGGGVIKALPLLGNEPFFILNADTFWIDHDDSVLRKMEAYFNPEIMDMLLLTVRRDQSASIERGDFLMASDRQLTRAPSNISEAVIYGGVLLVHPKFFHNRSMMPHSLNLYFDEAIANKRLFGFPLDGYWYTVGRMDMIAPVEYLLQKREK
ncbi:nucleotidyltransferase family protein [Bartonella tamiae]|uniref:Nucleotidyl transferase domain-containing protein n=1 Tax=Bartonella tamiae Th239 TaxID=1094558 RepID=J0QYC5_9HYPH|nr:nucleotidyltransferase family protein [Bartonella tamiae]EJF91111.1 hypothetical protein ME5_00443 [Bartonella tamiae Th239]EJF93224.1 hypothetical protein MEG_01438 [Bartonella tamiae Th307]